jgi:undecaprenyl-diphosphatase
MDQQILFFLNRSAISPAADWVMAVMSSADFWVPFLVLGGIAGAIWGGFRFRAFLLVLGLALGLTDAVVVDTLKGVVGRPRPNDMLEGVRTVDLAPVNPRFLALAQPLEVTYSQARIQPPGGNSFPSGHASNNFALATVVTVFFRRWGWVMFGPAVLVSYSRVYVGAHWPSDVVISAFIGAGLGLLVCAAAEALWRAGGPRVVPGLARRHPSLLQR